MKTLNIGEAKLKHFRLWVSIAPTATYLWINLLIQTKAEAIVLLRCASPVEHNISEQITLAAMDTALSWYKLQVVQWWHPPSLVLGLAQSAVLHLG